MCETNKCTGKKQSCLKRNIVYKTTCLECLKKGEDSGYYGESHRSSFERGGDHVQDYRGFISDSHTLKHKLLFHRGQEGEILGLKW